MMRNRSWLAGVASKIFPRRFAAARRASRRRPTHSLRNFSDAPLASEALEPRHLLSGNTTVLMDHFETVSTTSLTGSPPVMVDQSFTVAENSSSGTVVGTLAASDPDGDSLVFTIEQNAGTGEDAFRIEGDQLLVNDPADFDYESTSTYSVAIQVSDGTFTDNATVTVTVGDVPEAPIFEDVALSVMENSPEGLLVASFSATDPDGDALFYSITGNADIDGDGNLAFRVEGPRLLVNDTGDFDHETSSSFVITMQASDGLLTDSSNVSVTVADRSDTLSIRTTQVGSEADGSSTVFTLTRSIESVDQALSVNLLLQGTAGAGTDYTAPSGLGADHSLAVSFGVGQLVATINLPTISDSITDAYETIIAVLQPGTGYDILPGGDRAVAILTAQGIEAVPTANYPNTYSGGSANAGSGEQQNQYAFAALKSDGSITSWGYSSYGGDDSSGNSLAPTDNGYTQIFSTSQAFAALKSDGSITSWGNSSYGGDDSSGNSLAPTDSGYTQIFSNSRAFAALKADGTITSWGYSSYGGDDSSGNSLAPTDSGYTQIFSNYGAFAALKADGSITAWGSSSYGGSDYYGSGPPSGTGYTQIASTSSAFAALDVNGSIHPWGNTSEGGATAFRGTGYLQIVGTEEAFAALRSDGSITAWGDSSYGGSGAPTGNGYTQVFSNEYAFAALKSDGSITSWGNSSYGGDDSSGNSLAPTDSGYTQIFSNMYAFAALKSDGSITSWGYSSYGGDDSSGNSLAPTDSGYTQIFSNYGAFAALKSDGSITSWGNSSYGGNDYGNSLAPTDNGYTQIFSTSQAFAALKSDGSITSWGYSSYGGDDYGNSLAPSDGGYVGIANPLVHEVTTSLTGSPPVMVDQSFTVAENSSSGTVVGTLAASDPDGDSLVFTIEQNAGTGEDAFRIEGDQLLVNDPADFDYESTSTYSVAIQVSDGTFTDNATVTVTVGDVPEAPIFEDVALSVMENSPEGLLVASFSATDPDGDALFYSITGNADIDGDGNLAFRVEGPRLLVNDTGDFDHETSSSFVITMQASDGLLTDSSNVSVTVADRSDTLSISTTQVGSEADGSSTVFTLTRSIESVDQALSVNLLLQGTAGAGTDYTAPSGLGADHSLAVSFGVGQLVATINLPTISDSITDAYETIIAVLQPGTGYDILPGGDRAVAILTAQGIEAVPTANYPNTYSGGSANAGSGEQQNQYAFAALKSDGSITSWGYSSYGGDDSSGNSLAPTDNGYTQIFSTSQAFAALKSDGSITSWGNSSYGGDDSSGNSLAPTDSGYTQIFSNSRAFAALKADGTITSWGYSSYGGDDSSGNSLAPTDSGYTQIFSNYGAFAALKADGSITAWGSSSYGGSDYYGSGPPSGTGYTQIASTSSAFAALDVNGSIHPWGNTSEGGATAFRGTGYLQIVGTEEAFAALRSDGSITAWGDSSYGGSGAPTGNGYTQVFSNEYAFAALKSDGSITSWGNSSYGGDDSSGNSLAPTDSGYTQIFSNMYAFAALKSDGSITSWGYSSYGGDDSSGNSLAPTDSGYTQIFSNYGAFAALKSDGSITSWGNSSYGGNDYGNSLAPTDNGYTQIFSTSQAFAALKSDGSITSWGYSSYGGDDYGNSLAPSDGGYVGIANPLVHEVTTSLTGSPPVMVDQSFTVAENSSSGTVVGTLAASDPDGDSLVFTIEQNAGTGEDAFRIEGDQLLVNDPADFDYESTSTYSVAIQVSDGTFTDNATVTVTVGDVPEAPIFEDVALSVMENSPEGLLVASFSATDPDGDALFYSITGNADIDGDGNLAFRVEGPRLLVNDTGDFDHETSSSFVITMQASDGLLTDSSNVSVTVADRSDTLSIRTTQVGSEADGSSTVFTLTRSIESVDQALSVNLLLQGTAGAGTDYTAPSGLGADHSLAVSFGVGQLVATINLPTISDSITDAYETIIAVLQPGTGYDILPGGDRAVAILTAQGIEAVPTANYPNTYSGGSANAGSGEQQNQYAFAALKSDGSITSWGYSSYGGDDSSGNSLAPTDNGYTQIFSTSQAFAALKSDGSITSWGNSSYGGDDSSGNSLAPTDSGYTQIFSNSRAFAALKADGTITSWGYSSYGGDDSSGNSLAPTDSGYTQIFSNYGAFAALKADGSITAWGSSSYGGSDYYGSGPPSGTGYTQIASTSSAFAALDVNGSIHPWGNTSEGGATAFRGTGYLQIVGTEEAFAALRSDGSITAWGDSSYGGSGAPTGNGYTQVFSNEYAFAALKSDGSITSWGNSSYGGDDSSGNSLAPTDSGYTQIFSNMYAFAALKSDGSITSWGYSSYGGDDSSGNSLAPTDSGYTQIFSNYGAFAALKSDGSITSWGNSSYGGNDYGNSLAPTDNGYTQIFSTSQAFAALKSDGSITSWGYSSYGGDDYGNSLAPSDGGYVGIANPLVHEVIGGMTPVNLVPTLDFIANQTIAEDASEQTIALTGITAGLAESQTIAVSAESDNLSLLPHPVVDYHSPDTTASLRFAPVADQYGQASVTVTVMDGGADDDPLTIADNASVQRTFTVTVTPVNDAPPALDDESFTFNENHPDGSLVTTFIATDIDGDTLSYILSGQVDVDGDGSLPFSTSANQLIVNDQDDLDYESSASFSITVTVTDGYLSDNATFSFTLLDVNEGPVFGQTQYQVAEESASGTVVGTLNASDPEGNAVSYALLGSVDPDGDGNEAFRIEGDQLLVNDPEDIDYETNTQLLLTVEASDGTLSSDAEITVSILDVNTGPPVFDDVSFSVTENSAAGTLIGTLLATDPEDEPLSYSLLQNVDVDGDGTGAFSLSGDQLYVADADDLDYEQNTSLSIAVSASDGELSDSATVTINLGDVDEGPVFGQTQYQVTEESASGTVVGTLSASDPEGGAVSYALLGSVDPDGDGNEAFRIEGDQLLVNDPEDIDYETNTQLLLTVEASDGTLSSDASITVSILDVNTGPPVFDDASFSVTENSAAGTLIGTLMATDPEDEPLSYSFLQNVDPDGDGTGAFSISGDQLFVADADDLDYEQNTSLSIVVSASDGELSDSATVTINLGDVNEGPVFDSLAFSYFADFESGLPAEFTGTSNSIESVQGYSGVDAFSGSFLRNSSDPAEPTTLTLTDLPTHSHINLEFLLAIIDSWNGDGSDYFSIAIDGQLIFAESFANYPGDTQSYQPPAGVALGSGDFGFNSSYSDAAYNMGLDPTFTEIPHSDSTLTVSWYASGAGWQGGDNESWALENVSISTSGITYEVAEESASGTVVGTLSASDPEGNALSYALLGSADPDGDGNEAFRIEGDQLLVNDPEDIDYETNTQLLLTVEASDGTLSSDAEITVSILDVNAGPPVFDDVSFSVTENSAAGTLIGTLLATDPEDEPLSYSFLQNVDPDGDGTGAFSISGDQLFVADADDLDYEQNTSLSIAVSASDGELSDSATVTINLGAVDEGPVFDSLAFSYFTDFESGLPAEFTGTSNNVESVQGYSQVDAFSGSFLRNSSTGNPAEPTTLTLTGLPTHSHINLEFLLAIIDSWNGGSSPDYFNVSIDGVSIFSENFANYTNDQNYQPPPGVDLGSGDYGFNSSYTDAAYNMGLDPTFTEIPHSASTLTVSWYASGSGWSGGSNESWALENISISTDGITYEVAEESASGTVVGTLSASDPEGNAVSYALLGSVDPDGDGNEAFRIEGDQLLVNDPEDIDYETNTQLLLTVEASDGTLSTDASITVSILNVNAGPPVFDDVSFSVTENSAAGTLIGTLLATDPEDEPLSYSFLQNVDPDGDGTGAFSISGDQLFVADADDLDYEQNTSLSIAVSASDGELTDTATVTINLGDVNEGPVFGETQYEVAEESASGTVVGTLSASDPEGNAVSYALLGSVDPDGDGNEAFRIEGDQLLVNDPEDIDYETNTQLLLTVEASDGTLSTDASITVSILDVNAGPPVFDDVSFSVTENSAAGTLIGTLMATDPEDEPLSYSFLQNVDPDGDGTGAFSISGDQLFVADADDLDYEQNTSLSIAISASDGELTDTATVTINLGDVNEVPGSISGTKWHDFNEDGVRQIDEPGIENWQIYIDANENGQLDSGETSVTTDATGAYAFADVMPGSYVIGEVIPAGWKQTSPDQVNPATAFFGLDTVAFDPYSRVAAVDEYISDQVVVKIKGNLSDGELAELREDQLAWGAATRTSTKNLGIELWEINSSVTDAIDHWKNDSRLHYIQPNYKVSLSSTIPNDPSFSTLWGLDNTGQNSGTVDADIDAPEAWDMQTGTDVLIAVVDTGIDYTHPDLSSNIWTNPNEIPGNGIDDDGNGYVDDIHGYDFAYNDGDPMDVHSHGTHVAGTIAASGNDGYGITGVNWSAQLMAVKIFDDFGGYAGSMNVAMAIEYATMMGARVANHSWGGTGFDQVIYDALANAAAADSLAVVAAGNDSRDNDFTPQYPAGYALPNIISVASTDRYDGMSWFSNYGVTSVDLGAPGSDIYSTVPGGSYASYDGTSMATPHVTGVAGLVLAENPNLSAVQVKDIILQSVDPIDSLTGRTVTGGRLNAFNALSLVDVPGTHTVEVGWDQHVTGIDFGNKQFNAPPTLDPISDLTIDEDSAPQVISLTGISAGNGETQALGLTATTNNELLITQLSVNYTSPDSTGSLSFTPGANQNGTATIQVIAEDEGGLETTQSFTVTVVDTPDAPVFDDQSFTVTEESAAGTVIGQPVAIDPDGDSLSYAILTNADPDGDSTPAIRFENGSFVVNDAGDFDYEIGSEFTILAEVSDGTTADTAEITFSLVDVNEPPTLDPLSDSTIDEDSGQQTVVLNGIGPGIGNTDTATVSAQSSHPGTIPHPVVTYSAPDTTGSIAFTPVVDRFGAVEITVTVTDPQGAQTTQSFTVTVVDTPDAPVFDDQSFTVTEESAAGTVIGQPVAIDPDGDSLSYAILTNADPDGDSTPAVRFENGSFVVNDAGDFDYEIGSEFTILAEVSDGTTADTAEITFSLVDVNEPPTLDPLSDLTIDEDSGQQTVVLNGIGPGIGNTDTATVSAQSSHPGTIPHPVVTYSAPDTTGSIAFTPVVDRFGAVEITVTVTDPQGGQITQTFTVTVVGTPDAPVFDDQIVGIPAGSSEGTIVGTLGAMDPDGDSLQYTILSNSDPDGDQNQAFRIEGASLVVNDADDIASSGNFPLTLSVQVSDGTSDDTAQVTVIDSTPVVLSIEAAASGNEADGSPTEFTLTRMGSTDVELTVNLILQGSALPNVDYAAPVGLGVNNTLAVTFATGSDAATVSLPTITDSVIDSYENVLAILQPGGGYTVQPGADRADAYITAERVAVARDTHESFNRKAASSYRQRDVLSSGIFAALRTDGSIATWGDASASEFDSLTAGSPAENGYAQIFGNRGAFAALHSDGSVTAWGNGYSGGALGGAAENLASGVTHIIPSQYAFTAIKDDGSIQYWGNPGENAQNYPPSEIVNLKKIATTRTAFAALADDGTIQAWGDNYDGGGFGGGEEGRYNSPLDDGYTDVVGSFLAFAALREDGSIRTWGGGYPGYWADDSITANTPTDNGYVHIVASGARQSSFAAIKADGSITSWGLINHVPPGDSYTQIIPGENSFTAIRTDGSLYSWNGAGALADTPTETGITNVVANANAFAAVRADGSVITWGDAASGGDSSSVAGELLNVAKIVPTNLAFAALKTDGTVVTWGESAYGGNSSAVAGDLTNVTELFATDNAFAARRTDGSIVSWGAGGSLIGTPTGTEFVAHTDHLLNDRLTFDSFLSVSPTQISEGAGAAAATGTVTRTGSLVGDLVVTLASSDTSEATVPATVTIPDGQASASFPIDAVNDDSADLIQPAYITASVAGQYYGRALLGVADDGDGALFIDNTDPGFSENCAPAVSTEAGYLGSYVWFLGTSPDSPYHFQFEVEDIGPGNYEIATTWQSETEIGVFPRNTAVPYEIYDGNELVGSYTVNQQNVPADDYTAAGINFEILVPEVQIDNGSIRVKILAHSAPSGAYLTLSADAVRIALVGAEPNDPPTFSDQSFSAAENSAADTLIGTLLATDPDGHSLTYSITTNVDPDSDGNDAFRIEGAQLVVNDAGDLDYEANTQLVITAEASDGSLTDTAQITVNLTDVNDAPVVTHPGNQSDAEGDAVSLQLVGSDPDGDALTWNGSGLPTGLSLDAASGLISGTLGFDAVGSHTATVSVSDGSLSGNTSFTWTVTNTNRAPVLASPGNQSDAEGDAVSLQLVGSDPDGDALTWNGSGLPTGLSLDAASGLISGTLGFDAAGSYSVQVSASDGELSDTASFAWTVTDTNRAPEVTSPGNQTDAEGDAVSLQLVGSDPDGDSLTWNASGLPTGLSLDAASGLISGTLGFDAVGSHTATVSVSDGSLSGNTSFTWTVTNTNRPPVLASPGNQSDAEGDAVSLQLVGSDPDGDALTWNGSGLPTGLSLDAASGLISGTLGFDAAGSHTAMVSVSDGSLSASTSFTWMVANTNRPPVITSSATATVAENTTSVLTLAATDPDTEDSLTFAITGGADAARFAIETELVALRFISPPDFETPGSAAGTNLYELEVTVSDEGGLTDLQNITVTVTNVDEIPLITLLGDAVVNLEVDPGGTYSDAGATAWDPEDGDLSQAVEVGGQIVDLSLPGTYMITYDCEDLTGNAAVQVTRTVNVVAVNAAPVFADQAFTLAENSSEGTAVGTLAATDADGDALSYSIAAGTDPDGDGNEAFRIEGDKIVVNDADDLDYESDTQLVITAQASDGSLSDTAQITVNVSDVNEAPTDVALANEVTSLPENADTTSAIKLADIVITDDALGTNTITIINTSSIGSAITTDFQTSSPGQMDFPVSSDDLINSGSPYLANSYDQGYTPSAQDSYGPTTALLDGSAGTTTNYGVSPNPFNVLDVDGEWTFTVELDTSVSPAGYDISQIDTFTGHIDDRKSQAFELFVSTIETTDFISLGSFEHEYATPGSGSTRLRVTDASGTIATGVDAIRWDVTNLSEGSPGSDYREFDVFGTPSANDAANFEVIGTELFLVAGTALDYETQDSYAVTISVEDSSVAGSTPVTVNYTLAITAANAAPVFADQAFTLAENSSEGTAVGTLAATDPDGDALSYSIAAGTDPDGDGNEAFRIEGDQLLVNDPGDLDYETGPQLIVTAEASDGSLSDTAQITVNLTNVNDAPEFSYPAPQSVAEDTDLVFSAAGGNPLGLSDEDAGDGEVGLRIEANYGLLTLPQTTGLTFLFGSINGSHSLSVLGTIADINTALDGLIYSPLADYHGADTLSLTAHDLGHSGPGGNQMSVATVEIAINPVNDAPQLTIPADQTTPFNTTLFFSAANDNAIQAEDVDAGTAEIGMLLSLTSGTFSLAQTTGLTLYSGSDNSSLIMCTGTLANINAALEGLSYTPSLDVAGDATLTILLNDLGNSGSGNELSDTKTVVITAETDDEVSAVTILDSSEGAPGFVPSSSSGWITQSSKPLAYLENTHKLKIINQVSGTQAEWSFTDLPNGQYKVATTWWSTPSRATAPYTIGWGDFGNSSGGVLATKECDQTQAPDDFTDGDGWTWEELGTVNVEHGELRVRLEDGIGPWYKNLIADAVRIEKLGSVTPALTVAIAADSVAETAGAAATTATVTRTDSSGNLVVTLASDDVSEATAPSSVTILDGQSSASFEIAAVDDAAADGTQTVTFSATATGYTAGSDTLEVTDDESALVTIIDNGESGFTQTGFSYQNNSQVAAAYDGDNHTMWNGTGEATWTFSGLENGEYQVTATWAHKYGNRYNAPAAPFAIEDGSGAVLASVTVDQRNSPSQFAYEGYYWDTLGTVSVSDGALVVTLGADAQSNTYSVADAVRIEKLLPSARAAETNATQRVPFTTDGDRSFGGSTTHSESHSESDEEFVGTRILASGPANLNAARTAYDTGTRELADRAAQAADAALIEDPLEEVFDELAADWQQTLDGDDADPFAGL